MKHFKTILLLTIFFIGVSMTSKAEEITLFNSEGEAIAYIDADDDDLTIYLWNGTPVAYLDPSGDAYNIYGFNGKHLGWFEDGIVRDHEGYGVGCFYRREKNNEGITAPTQKAGFRVPKTVL
jgi:hypothetical protein